jgi:ACS family glucarate transporter-like MFS transporter
MATAAPAIKTDLVLSDAAMGFVFSVFAFAYALVEVPSGWLADRFGGRVTLTRTVLWWSAMTAATGRAGGLLSLVLIRLLLGAGEAGAFPVTARVYARWLPCAKRERMFGLAIMTGALAGAATQPVVVALLARMSWRHVFAIFGSVGILWALAWMSTFGNLSGAASPIVVGIALQRWGSWEAPLLSVAALYVVSALCRLAIDPAQRIEAGR